MGERPGGLVAVLVVAGALGGATSWLQTLLPHAVAPLANSARSWCAVAWLLARPATGPGRGALTSVLALVALVTGYYVVADLRGFGVGAAPVATWLAVAVLVGPLLGVSAVRSRRARGMLRLLAALVLPGLLAAEAAYGLLVVGATTSTGYWVGEGVVAVLLAVLLVRTGPSSLFADSDHRLTPEHVGWQRG